MSASTGSYLAEWGGVWLAGGFDLDAVADRVAADLGIPVDARITDAVNMASNYIADDSGVPVIDWGADDTRLQQGTALLAERMYQDTSVPSGNLSSFEDGTFSGSQIPLVLYRHLEEYWRHLRSYEDGNWGFA